MDNWKATALVLLGVVIGMACKATAAADGASEHTRTVIYLADYLFEEGVMQTNLPCTAYSFDGAQIDYNACCPEGFSPVGMNNDNGVACLED